MPFVYRYYPTVREARERVASGQTGALRLLHGTYLQDWLLRADDDNWRVDEQLGGASRAFADIGSHWCDLAEFVSGHRIARVSARLLTAVPERASAAGVTRSNRQRAAASCAPSTTEDAAARPVRDRRRGDRLGGRQPGLRRPQEPALDRARRRRGGARLRPGASGGALVRAARGADDRAPRSRRRCRRRPRASRSCPPVTRRATRTASTRSSRTSTRRSRRLAGREGMPTFADGLRAALITDAVLDLRPRGALGRRGGEPGAAVAT